MEKNFISLAENFFSFIKETPSEVFTINKVKMFLLENGYKELNENKSFEISYNNKYFIERDGEALIAFTLPQKVTSLHIISSHADSPCLKVKHNGIILDNTSLSKLNTEVYGGMNMYSYFDRPLTLSGKVAIENNSKITTRLYKSNNSFIIPSLAIHQDRTLNEGHKISAQKELLPLFCDDNITIEEYIASALKVKSDEILDYDLFLTNSEEPKFLGAQNEYFSSPRIDNTECVWLSLMALLNSKSDDKINMIAIFNNEETGSLTYTGALSDFLSNTIKRIFLSLKIDEEDMIIALSKSLMVSADNGHAVHPNYSEKSDVTNHPKMNGGVLLKYSAAGKYTTTPTTGARLIKLMKENDIPYQIFHNNSDVRGGSTLGALSGEKISIPTVDVGAVMLSMHSALETAGIKDLFYLEKLFKLIF